MKNQIIVSSIITVGTLFTGCTTDYGYNSTRGVAKGAVIGSVLGGVIGHQSGETKKGLALGAVLGGIVGNEIGQRQDQRARDAAREYSIKRQRPASTSRTYGPSRVYGRTEDPDVLNSRQRAEAAEHELEYLRRQRETTTRREEQIREYEERARIARDSVRNY